MRADAKLTKQQRQPAGRRPRRHRARQRQRHRRRPPRPPLRPAPRPERRGGDEPARRLGARPRDLRRERREHATPPAATARTSPASSARPAPARTASTRASRRARSSSATARAPGLAILDVIGGFDYAIANRDRYGIDVITNSWGDTDDSCTAFDPNHPVTRATYDTYRPASSSSSRPGTRARPVHNLGQPYKKAPWVIGRGRRQGARAGRLLLARHGGRRRLLHARREDWTWRTSRR